MIFEGNLRFIAIESLEPLEPYFVNTKFDGDPKAWRLVEILVSAREANSNHSPKTSVSSCLRVPRITRRRPGDILLKRRARGVRANFCDATS